MRASMKVIVAALLFALPARAQFGTGFPPVASIRIQNGGTTLAVRPFLNCIGQTTCAVQSNSAISISVAAGAGGTLQTAYNNSAGANPSILETAANGAVTIKGPAVANGTLFLVQDGVPNNLLGISDNGASRLDSVGALNLGTTTATGINYGNGTITHAFTGSLTDNTVAATFRHSAADNYGATPTAYLTLENTTAAAVGAQQFSPFIALQGRGWETTGGTSQTVGWQVGVRPVQAATNDPELVFYQKNATANAYTEIVKFTDIAVAFNGATARLTNNNGNGEGIFIGAGQINQDINGTAITITKAGLFQPGADNADSLGSASARWSTMYTEAVNSGAATALTITGNAASTWSTSAGALTLNGTSGINLQAGAATLMDIGVTTASTVTLAANINFVGTAGTGALTLGSMTGASTMPTGNWSWTGASTKTFAATSTGAAGTISLTSGDALNFSYGANSTWSATAAGAAATGFSLTQTGSNGGAATAGSNGGVGGFISTTAGTGGADSAAHNGGNGGALTEQAGTGGSATTNSAGAGGVASLIGGSGGGNTAAGGGAGGAVNITGGAGGSSAIFTGANGGAVNISGGTPGGNGNTGAINLQTNTVLAANVNLSTTAGTTAVDLSNGTGIFKTTTGVSTFGGSSNNFTNTITLSANAGISGTAGTGALALGSLTGDSNFPTGQFNWAGAANKTASLVGASTFTITAGAASTWSTTSGALTVQGASGVNLGTTAGGNVADVGASSSTAVTVLNAQSLNTNAAAQGSHVLMVASAPTISSGFGASTTIEKHNGTAAFRISLGLSPGSSGTIGLPTATNGWNCFCSDVTTQSATAHQCTQITNASPTTTATIGNFNDLGAAATWPDNDHLAVSCFAF